MQLFHGGDITSIEDTGLFRGVFATPNEMAARSHGKLNVIEVDDSKVLSDFELNYEVDTNETRAAFEAVCEEEGIDTDSDIIWDAVIEDANVYEMDEADVLEAFEMAIILQDVDLGNASWAAQRMRGQVAKKLGFDAVEMDDEHGNSYLVTRGTFEVQT